MLGNDANNLARKVAVSKGLLRWRLARSLSKVRNGLGAT